MLRQFLARRATCLLVEARDDPDAFAAFYDAYAERVLIYLTRRVLDVDTAFDLLSETFATALEQRGKFRGATAEEEQGWLFAIARSELSHYWRRGTVERAALERMGIEPPELSSAEIERIEELGGLDGVGPRLARALGMLPAEQRDAVDLRVLQELGYPDIAARLGVTEDVVRARVSRGLRALRGEMA